jgi:integrase
MTKIPTAKTGLAATPYGKAIRIYELVELYLKSERFTNLSPRSKQNYMSVLKSMEDMKIQHNEGLLGVWAHRITYQTADFIKRGLSYSIKPATVALRFAVMSCVWELGIRNGYLSSNPWDKAKIRLDNLREMVWTTEQINAVITKAKDNGYDVLALYVSMAYATGQRPFSDLRGMKWDNLRQENGSWIFDFVIQKTNTRLMLPLDDKTVEILMGIERVSEYIFVDKKGRRLTPSCIASHLNTIKFKLGLPKELLLRDLRRTAVTEMAQGGATVSEITALTGWKTSEKMLNRYAVMRLATAQHALTKRTAFQNDAIPESSTIL